MILNKKKNKRTDTERKRQILNAIAESKNKTLTTTELVDILPIGKRTIQNYVRELEDEGKLVLHSKGKPNHWRLSDTEPKEPIYREEYALAKRTANKASKIGDTYFIFGVSILAAVGFLTTTIIYSPFLSILPSFLQNSDAVVAGGLIGIIGVLLFLASFLSKLLALTLPSAVEWRIGGRLPKENKKCGKEV